MKRKRVRENRVLTPAFEMSPPRPDSGQVKVPGPTQKSLKAIVGFRLIEDIFHGTKIFGQ